MQHPHKLAIQSIVRGIQAASAFAVLIGAASCSDSTGLGAGSASQIAFSTLASATADAALNTVPVTNGGHTLDLAAATLTVTRAELKRAKTDVCPSDEDEDDDDHPPQTASTENCGELKIGPTTVDLPLTGTLTTLPANTIPAGTFREFELRISQVELKGTFDGKAFDVVLPVRVKTEIEFATPFVVTAGAPTLITVNVPVNTWLVNANGSLVDPSTILTSPSAMALIKSRIAASLRAFEDRDHDGHDDHGGKEGHG
jgi:hypothetical protein